MDYRILHLIMSLAPGGAEKQMTYLARALHDRGVDVHVGYFGDGPNRSLLEERGVPLHRLPLRGSYDPRAPFQLHRLIRRLAPDLVETWIPAVDVTGGLAARASGKPWILSERNAPDWFPDSAKFRLRRWLARGASAVISNSRAGDAYWEEQLGSRVPRYVIRNALPEELVRGDLPPIHDDFGFDPQRPLVLYAGRLIAQKNVPVTLRALEQVVRETDAVALVAGIGPEQEYVRTFIREHGLEDRMVAPGFLPSIWSWMRRATVFVSVSHHEGMPNTVAEVAALGTPLVISKIPQHTDLLPDECAVYTGTDDPREVAAAIRSVLDDPVAARARAEKARAVSRGWTIGRAADRYAEVYEQVLAGVRR
ncbi:MAG: glycosyltransferase [Myxococcota bacterium]